MKRNLINKTVSTLLTGLIITTSGLILETPAHAEGRYWCADTVSYTDKQLAYTYKSATGATVTTNDLGLAQRCAIGDIQTKNGVLQNTQEDRNKAIKQEKINKQLEMQKPENQPISYEEFTRIANQEMLRLVNKHREENGLNPLEWDDTLAKMAIQKAEHMKQHNYFEHSYKGINTMILQCIEWNVTNVTENALGNSVYPITEKGAKDMATSMFYQWKCSPGHDKQMVNPDFTKFAFGFSFNDKINTSYAIQKFADDRMYDYKDGDIWLDCGATKLSDLDNL